MVTISDSEDFFTTYIQKLDKSADTLYKLNNYLKGVLNDIPDSVLPLWSRVVGDITTVSRDVQQSADTLRTTVSFAKGVDPVTGKTIPYYPNVQPPAASLSPTVASSNASVTPTVAGDTPNAKNNNSVFLWALAAIGGIGLFSALSTGKRK